MSEQPPEIDIKPARRSLWERASIVWLVPIAALIISLTLAYQNYNSRGPVIIITFSDASGIRAGETELRYRDVTIGVVEKVGFTTDLSRVRVDVRLDASVAPFVDTDAEFWIVSPEVTARGISGLETVLSGVFIEATWDEIPGGLAYEFEGAAAAPLVRPGQEGLLITLRTTAGEGLSDGTPIFYKGIEVGLVSNSRIAPDGVSSIADAFIESPHDRLINTSTRFWDTSGFTFSIGADGADINFQSLAALISGGVTFDTIISGGEVVERNSLFRLYIDEATARNSVFADPDSNARLQLSVVFEGNASGLAVGAPVELGGITVGEVTGITGLVEPDTFGDTRVHLLATMAIRPGRIGLGDEADPTEILNLLDLLVADGLRARLAAASIFTGGLKVEFAQIDDAPVATIDRGAIPFPVFPSAPAVINEATATAEGVLERINKLPIEEVLQSAINLMDSGTLLIAGDELNAIPEQVLGLVDDARGLIGSPEVQALPDQIATTAAAIEAAAVDLQSIIAQIEEQDGVARLLAAVDSAGETAEALTLATEDLPTLITSITALSDKANTLELETLLAEVTDLVARADIFLASEALAQLPTELNAALSEVRTTLSTFNAEGGTESLIAAIDAAASAASQVETATADLPELINNLTSLSTRIRDLPVDEMVQEVTSFLESAQALITSQGATDLPANLNTALDEIATVLRELREGGTVENVNATLSSASDAAASIQAAADELPALMDRLNRVLSQAEGTLAGLDEDSQLSREARAALRDIQSAADAVTSLARAIERNPNSLLTGR